MMRDRQTSEPALLLAELRPGMHVMAVNTDREQALCSRVRLALTPWSRLRGLIGTPRLCPGDALLLRPCRSIHTCWMQYPIDVLFLDSLGAIVGMRCHLAPWRLTPAFRRSVAALELAAGTVARTGSACGDCVAFHRVGCYAPARS